MRYFPKIKKVGRKILFILVALVIAVGFLAFQFRPISAAYPEVESVTDTEFDSDTTTHDVDMPTTVNSGDLLLVLFTSDGNASVTTPSGWTQISSETRSSFVRGSIYAKISDGTEGGTSVNFETSSSEQAAAHVYRITGWFGDIDDGIDFEVASTASNSLNPPSLSPDWGSADNLWIPYLFKSSSNTVTGYPSSYDGGTTTTTEDTTSGATVASATRTLSTGTEDPSSFGAGGSTGVYTIAIRPGSGPEAPTFHPEDGSNQIAFNNIRQNSASPTFRVSATHTDDFNRFQLELNTASNFEGTAYTQTFSGTYTSDTEYNLIADNLSPSLPTTNNAVYYVRARASADGGSSWGNWSVSSAESETQTLNTESFESNFGDWTPDSGDCTWSRNTGETSSGSTGPDDGNTGSWYIYAETSSSACVSDYAVIEYGPIDATDYSDLDLSFYYHMYGDSMGDLTVEVNDGSGYEVEQTISGEQHNSTSDPYTQEEIDLSSYSGEDSVSIRFRYTGSSSFTGDAALDDIEITYTENANTGELWTYTYKSASEDPDWFQTSDEQFNKGTLTDTQITGNGSIELDGESTGTIMSTEIDYDWFDEAVSWNTFDWLEDETDGNISVQLYYTSSTPCDTIVPNGALSGNSSGFTSGPVDISGLNTTTYNRICLLATLNDDGGTPYLEDWMITWDAFVPTPTPTNTPTPTPTPTATPTPTNTPTPTPTPTNTPTPTPFSVESIRIEGGARIEGDTRFE